MWNVKSKIDTSNNRDEWNHLKITQYLSNIPGKHEIKELQKTAILGIAHILWEGLM
jgi:hypothetical protein